MRPPVASASRSPGRFGAPTSSRTTSNGPVLGEALGLEHLVRAELAHAVAGARVADGGGDARAGGGAELHGRGAHAARRAVHEQALAGAAGRPA